jgi:hypothetical protein
MMIVPRTEIAISTSTVQIDANAAAWTPPPELSSTLVILDVAIQATIKAMRTSTSEAAQL